MKFEEIPAPSFSLRVKSKNAAERLPIGDVQEVKLNPECRGELKLYIKDKIFTVKPTNSASANELTFELASGQTILAKLTDRAPDGSAKLNIVQFNGKLLEVMNDIEIGIDEQTLANSVLKSLRRYNKSRKNEKLSLNEAIHILEDNCTFEHSGKKYFFLLAGDAAKEYNRNESSNDDNSEETEPDVKNESDDYNVIDDHGHFAVLGSDIRFSLSQKSKGNGETILLTSQLTYLRNKSDSAIRLACGNLKFVDWTATGAVAFVVKCQLDKLIENDGSYLKKWDEFQIVEGEMFFENVRKLGIISFTIISVNKDDKEGDAIVVKCHDLNEDQKSMLESEKVDALHCVDDEELPDYLTDLEMSFAEYYNSVIQREANDEYYRKKSKKLGVLFRKRCFDPVSRELTLTINVDNGESIPNNEDIYEFLKNKKLIYPIKREITPIMRRLFARYDIQNGRAANPNIGLLIEEGGVILPTQKHPNVEPLSCFVNNKVFKDKDPTDVQVDAIRLALNTPDIALIQGPPGTGKTTVIAAIIERLNEEKYKCVSMKGSVLLTSYQHDAVENMNKRMNINGLPVPKFGKRSSKNNANGLSPLESQMLDWCKDRIKDLREKHKEIEEVDKENQLRVLYINYINDPSTKTAIQLLNQAIKYPYISKSLRKSLQNELAQIQNELNSEQAENSALPFIRGLRTTENSFADDGALRAVHALEALRNENLNEADRELLEKASVWINRSETPPFLKELKSLKRRLLKLYTPAPVYRIEKLRDKVCTLIKDTIDVIQRNGYSIKNAKTAAVAELLFEMENNPEGISKDLVDYCFAFAATCQQSDNNNEIVNLKDSKWFDVVVVDEAARVSPLDLMIALKQGKRVILVGDHRQLPQLIDDDVIKRMEEETNNNVNQNNTTFDKVSEIEWIKKSMFEYMFTERLPALKKADNITRRITLKTQYRMHPILGDFISRNFYERFDPEEKFDSGLDESYFVHQLPGTDGKCAVWIDVPFKNGGMRKKNNSWTRPAEASVICRQLKEWIEFDNSQTSNSENRLKFGIITFYKAQAELISEYLGEQYLKSNAVGDDRLRIGTVDSFQGMEFDVVFLSLVRTANPEKPILGKYPFGFLEVYNRLNVSMSRQKKLLVVVGDSDFYNTDLANEKVPGLFDFLRLCREMKTITRME
ncbi:MAG: AAA family ATPase [Thermoguttaceae bacterium]|nr:AAA family ATPase [Thermoguttaceae bacterium]